MSELAPVAVTPEQPTDADTGDTTGDPETTGTEADAPVPLGVELPATGHPDVDALLERLGDADALPTGNHIEVYEDVHRGLRDALTALDNNRS